MYRPHIKPADRLVTIAGVVLIHAGLALALLNVSGRIDLATPQSTLEVFDISEPEPPPPPVIEQPKPEPKPKDDEGAASAANIKSKATPVVAPKPKVVVPAPPTVVVAPTPGTGAQPTQGAAPVPGPGTGAGGTGTGTGSGGSGSGTGGGGSGGANAGLLRGITNRDFPPQIQRMWPRGGAVFVRLRIQPDGRVSQCDVMKSIGNPNIDQWTCALLMQQRARFRPATDASGRPIAAWYGYIQRDLGRFDR